ncbi:hypothetical protein LTR74_018764, partial [Friedmanniomyces endolithicus]
LGASQNIVPSLERPHPHTLLTSTISPASITNVDLTFLFLSGVEHAFHGIKTSLSTARRCHTICANGSLRSLHRLRAGLCARYGRNALELGVYTQLISTQENKPGISLSEGAPRAPTREQKSHLHNFHHIEPSTGKKRRRKADEEASEQSQEPCHKRNKEGFERGQQQDSNCHKEGAEEQDPIQCWARTGEWPKAFGQMSKPESDGSHKRRWSSTRSYSSRGRNGSAPPVHSAAYEEELQRYGIMFDDLTTKDLLTAESKDLCQALLGLDELAPAYNSCSEKMYIESKCKEERSSCTWLTERPLWKTSGRRCLEIGQISLLGGTQPRPDYAYGLSSATFTGEERAKMENYTNINNPTKFTESMYFPFLLCEAKCGKKNVNDADRQNVHSASIAVNAIIQLCRTAGEDGAQSLSGHILVFSISHDNERVKIYGHFPIIRDGRITFHRHI